MGRIAAGESAQLNYEIGHDAEYFLTVKLESGKEFKSDGRYITSGFNFEDKIEVTSSGIKLKTSSIR